jgi:hypothetical protein
LSGDPLALPGKKMIRLLTAAASLLAGSVAIAQPTGDVLRLNPALDALVSPDAKVELIKGGFGFTEGPVWVQKARTAIFCSPTSPAT